MLIRNLCTSLMMIWLHWLMDSSGHSKDYRLSVLRSWMGRLCLTKESSITFNIVSLSAEYNWQSMRTCAAVCASPWHSHKRVSDSLILKMWSFCDDSYPGTVLGFGARARFQSSERNWWAYSVERLCCQLTWLSIRLSAISSTWISWSGSLWQREMFD